ncbi:uncharacterized protein LOC110238850 [Exaiptasia diaphana]|uniref:DH domain-containing protein n=1 Tax=Exaiptasia diaphana TaxID=2652724 RepID=A0A913X7J1_EXADI|nr:uncharacterized protein LOC110238850 [Exaiptasia diaphana]KXJ14467.1 Protein ECT2 [Exaiptasia diaphana]
MGENIDEVKEKTMPNRPVLGRRVTCQYYSPALVLSSNDEKRLQVVLELFQTEEKYSCCLHTLKTVFEDKLKSSNIIPVKDIESIFPTDLKEIRDVHDRLCGILKARIQQWNYRSKVGDVFVEFFSDKNQFDVIGHYSSYSNNFPKAIRTISRCVRQSVEFEAFLKNCSNGPSLKGLDLHALLLNPIQRLPRYLLLLKQLIRFTDLNHPDRSHVEQAMLAMSQTVTVLNNSIESSLKVACEYTTRKRLTRRRLPIHQREAIKVLNRNTDQLVITREIKPKQEESSSSTGQSRPASICSSVSSGYASGEENDNVTSPAHACTCPCNGPTCSAKQQDFSRIVKELRHESALEQLAKQNFDFSVSVISPTLQRLHEFKRQKAIPESTEKPVDNVSDSSDCHTAESISNKVNDNEERTNEQHVSESIGNNIDQTMDNFIEDFSTSLNKIEYLHHMKLLSPEQPGLSDHDSYGSERDLGYLSPLNENILTSQSSSNLKRFQRNRRSWAPQSSFSKQFCDGVLPSQSVIAGSLHNVAVEDDNVSIWSGLSTLSGDSATSGVSAMSVPVDGKHASKRRYFRLKEFFKQLRGKERRSQSLIQKSTMPTIPQEDRTLVSPRMMISSV